MDDLAEYLERLKGGAQRRPPRRKERARTDEGARRRAQQQALMRRLAEAESAAGGDGTTLPAERSPTDMVIPPRSTELASAPESPVDSTPEPPDLGSAIVSVLRDLGLALSVPELLDWLAESGIQAEEVEVTTALSQLKPRLEESEGRWRFVPTRLDPSQQDVAFAPLQERMLVLAPPGAGKTEVACARVAHAINSGVNARSVMMVSYTRAATAELKDRISRMVDGGESAMRGVEIRTLDSLAWMLQRHLTDEQLLTGSYADNIDRCIELLSDPPDELQEHFGSLRLLVIDEAQDVVGARSELAVRLIAGLPAEAGVTVFADPAQAIYGDWALDEGHEHGEDPPLHERIDSGEIGDFRLRELSGSHRTDNPDLLGISTDLRTFALVRDMTAGDAHEGIYEELHRRAGIGRASHQEMVPLIEHDSVSQFFLFRTHGEVTQLSSYMSGAGIPHRLRYPGLPVPVYPWIGRLLSEWEDRRLRQRQFDELWTERVAGTRFDTGTPEVAWATLIDVAGDEQQRVDVWHLREILSRRNPPDEVIRPTLGEHGPILSTIHGSKGREAEDVVLGLTAVSQEGDRAEEARVLYVGATRAKSRLRVAEVRARYGYLQSRRAWRYMNRPGCALLEFGLQGDVDLLSPVSKSVLSDVESRDLQDHFASTEPHEAEPAYWKTERGDDYRRHLRVEGGDRYIGLVGERFVQDMWQLGKVFGSSVRPGDYQRFLYVVDYTTVARDTDSPDLNQLTDTYASSGFWVAPLVKGQGGICLNRSRQR